jgi:two-component system OmpR family response regulator
MAVTIGFVEDDDVIRENYSDFMESLGYRVRAFPDRLSALQAFRESLPDLAVLDVGLGDERDGGYQLCLELRGLAPKLPIIFLTSFDSEADKISGLRLGADDHLSKEASLDFLAVRIAALLRRYVSLREGGHERNLVIGDLRIDRERSQAFWRNQAVDLPLTEFWMVDALTRKPGTACSHEDLMRAARIVVEPNTIAAHMKAIRQRFRAVDPTFDAIRTERGLGYRWITGEPGEGRDFQSSAR